MIIQRWVQRMKCYFVARCMNYRRSKTLSMDTHISSSITSRSFLKLKAPNAIFLEAAKRDILRQLMFLCNIFPRLHVLKGSSIMCSDVEPDFRGKQNDDSLWNKVYNASNLGPIIREIIPLLWSRWQLDEAKLFALGVMYNEIFLNDKTSKSILFNIGSINFSTRCLRKV